METEIQDMSDLEVIEPSVSPYSSPIVLVPKKDGSVRFYIDFRKLNKVTEFVADIYIRMWVFDVARINFERIRAF